MNNSAISAIFIAAGLYTFISSMEGGAALSIGHDVRVLALVPGSVVLDAQGTTGNPRRVVSIGSSAAVELVGLNITGGYADDVCAAHHVWRDCPRTTSNPLFDGQFGAHSLSWLHPTNLTL